MEQKFGTAVAISERLIHTAYSNRLSRGALHHDALIEAVKYVNEIACNSDMLSFVHQPSDLFLVETSYIYKPDEKTFVLVLHVPLVTPHNLMPLYKFIPLPIHFNFSGNVSVTPEVGATNMIAVGHSQSYQLLSFTDLQSCNKMGETYFCKGRNVLLTDLTKPASVPSTWRTTKTFKDGASSQSEEPEQRSFIWTATHTWCTPLGKSVPTTPVQRQRLFWLSRFHRAKLCGSTSCYIRTMDHIITADESEEITIHSKWLDWTWTLGQLFLQSENEVVTTAIAKLQTKISGKFDAEVLLHELETMTKEAKELAKEVPFNHWIFTSPGTMIGATLVCLFILFCCWRLCRSNNTAAPVLYPTAPPAPPTVFNMTVDPIRR
jgi:hypothetical protein